MATDLKERMIPRVLTLDEAAYADAARRIAQLIEADLPPGGYDVLTGVKRGGTRVCDAMCRHLADDFYAVRVDVSLQRAGTRMKGSALKRVLKRLPRKVSDLLRIVESYVLDAKRSLQGDKKPVEVELPVEFKDKLQEKETPRVLIVDDAIDSGETIYSIEESIRKINPHAEIRVVVLTVTTARPRVSADYALYRDRTLLRLPGAPDY